MTAAAAEPLDLTRSGWARPRVSDEQAEPFLRGLAETFREHAAWWRTHLLEVVARPADARRAALATLRWSEWDDVRLARALEGSVTAGLALHVFLPPEVAARFTLLERRLIFEAWLTLSTYTRMLEDPLAAVAEPDEAALDWSQRLALPAVRFEYNLLSGSVVVQEVRRRLYLSGDRRTRARPQSVAWLGVAAGLHEALASGWTLVPPVERERAVADLAAIVSGGRGVGTALRILGEQAPEARRAEQDAHLGGAVLEAAHVALRAPTLADAVEAASRTAAGASTRIRQAGRDAVREVRAARVREALDEGTATDAPLTAREAHVEEHRAEMVALLLADPRGRRLFEYRRRECDCRRREYKQASERENHDVWSVPWHRRESPDSRRPSVNCASWAWDHRRCGLGGHGLPSLQLGDGLQHVPDERGVLARHRRQRPQDAVGVEGMGRLQASGAGPRVRPGRPRRRSAGCAPARR